MGLCLTRSESLQTEYILFVAINGESERHKTLIGERSGLVVNASDSRSRGRGFEPPSGQTVLRP